MRAVVGATRWREWVASKFAYVSGGTLLGLGVAAVPTSVGIWPWLAGLLWVAALLAFGYTWNDRCDRADDRRAGRAVRDEKLLRTASVVWAAAMLLSGIMLAVVAESAWTLLLMVATMVLAWAYSVPGLRLKERGLAGVVTGALSQRALPLLVLLHAVEAPPMLSAGLVCLATAWGVRAMVTHQVLDAANDGVADVDTWVRRHPHRALRVVRVLGLCELGAATVVATSMVVTGGVVATWSAGAAAIVAVVVGFRLRQRVRRRQDGPSRWLSFASPPFAPLHAVALPLAAWSVVVVVDPVWGLAAGVDLTARKSELFGVLDHFVDRPELDRETTPSW